LVKLCRWLRLLHCIIVTHRSLYI